MIIKGVYGAYLDLDKSRRKYKIISVVMVVVSLASLIFAIIK